MRQRALAVVFIVAVSVLMAAGAALADDHHRRSGKGYDHPRDRHPGHYRQANHRLVVEKHVVHRPAPRVVKVVHHHVPPPVTVVEHHYHPAPPPPPRHYHDRSCGHAPAGGVAFAATICDPGFVFSIATGRIW